MPPNANAKRKGPGGAKTPKFPKRLCRQCGKEFQAKRRWHDFCSRPCRVAAWKEENGSPAKVAELERRIVRIEKAMGISDHA